MKGSGNKADPYQAQTQSDVDWFKANAQPGEVIIINGKPYTIVNTGLGVRWARDKVVTSLKITNLGNQEVQQHIFGDIVKRQAVGEARVTF